MRSRRSRDLWRSRRFVLIRFASIRRVPGLDRTRGEQRQQYRAAQAYPRSDREQARVVAKFHTMLAGSDRDALKCFPAALNHDLCAIQASAPAVIELFGKPEVSSR